MASSTAMRSAQIILSTIILISLVPAAASPSDESGTLMGWAMTKQGAALVIDSQISGSTSGIYPKRKFVRVGKNSACVLVKYLGSDGPGLDVAGSIRSWVATNPSAEIPEALNGVLNAAALAWNNHGYQLDPTQPLPAGRSPYGDADITHIYCIGTQLGKPILVAGLTGVQRDRSASIQLLPEITKELFYLDGAYNEKALYQLGSSAQSGQLRQIDLDLWHQLSNTDDSESYKALIKARAKGDPSEWSMQQAKTLLSDVFSLTEKYYPKEVARPNQSALQTNGTLDITTLEADWNLDEKRKIRPAAKGSSKRQPSNSWR